jgi:hypothetical protein
MVQPSSPFFVSVSVPGGMAKGFLSILSIKRGNWFYWAARAETAERAESKETRVFMPI